MGHCACALAPARLERHAFSGYGIGAFDVELRGMHCCDFARGVGICQQRRRAGFLLPLQLQPPCLCAHLACN